MRPLQGATSQMVGINIKTMRKTRGLTAAELAERVQVHPSQISFMEQGRRRITVDDLVAIADALGVTASALLDPAAARQAEIERLRSELAAMEAAE